MSTTIFHIFSGIYNEIAGIKRQQNTYGIAYQAGIPRKVVYRKIIAAEDKDVKPMGGVMAPISNIITIITPNHKG